MAGGCTEKLDVIHVFFRFRTELFFLASNSCGKARAPCYWPLLHSRGFLFIGQHSEPTHAQSQFEFYSASTPSSATSSASESAFSSSDSSACSFPCFRARTHSQSTVQSVLTFS